MAKVKDLTGQRFGRLTVISRAENRNQNVYWHCRCDCGAEKIIRGCNLKSGDTKSCGCLLRESYPNAISKTRLYQTWQGLICRYCNEYVYYNGNRITLCHEWYMDYQAFYDYVSKLPHFGEEGYKLFRINKGKNFEPDNVKWAKPKGNKNNLFVSYNGKKMSLVQAAEVSGISYSTLLERYHKGYTGRKLFHPPTRPKIYVEYNGEKLSLIELAQKTGINFNTLRSRHFRGDKGERLIRPAVK